MKKKLAWELDPIEFWGQQMRRRHPRQQGQTWHWTKWIFHFYICLVLKIITKEILGELLAESKNLNATSRSLQIAKDALWSLDSAIETASPQWLRRARKEGGRPMTRSMSVHPRRPVQPDPSAQLSLYSEASTYPVRKLVMELNPLNRHEQMPILHREMLCN